MIVCAHGVCIHIKLYFRYCFGVYAFVYLCVYTQMGLPVSEWDHPQSLKYVRKKQKNGGVGRSGSPQRQCGLTCLEQTYTEKKSVKIHSPPPLTPNIPSDWRQRAWAKRHMFQLNMQIQLPQTLDIFPVAFLKNKLFRLSCKLAKHKAGGRYSSLFFLRIWIIRWKTENGKTKLFHIMPEDVFMRSCNSSATLKKGGFSRTVFVSGLAFQ